MTATFDCARRPTKPCTMAGIMFSYRHAFHAGNHADVLKHMTLVAILRYLTSSKETPLLLADTHAGTGLYRLDGGDAQTSGEASEGVLPLQGMALAPDAAKAPEALAAYFEVLTAFNGGEALRKYPGSPFITATLMFARPVAPVRTAPHRQPPARQQRGGTEPARRNPGGTQQRLCRPQGLAAAAQPARPDPDRPELRASRPTTAR